MNSRPTSTIEQRLGDKQFDPIGDMLSLTGRPTWHKAAACNGVGAEIFFPGRGESAEAAKRFCETCTVVTECLDSSLEHRDNGVWAGTSGRQRRKIRRLPTRSPEAVPTEQEEQQESA